LRLLVDLAWQCWDFQWQRRRLLSQIQVLRHLIQVDHLGIGLLVVHRMLSRPS
jgi:hypothetical protein